MVDFRKDLIEAVDNRGKGDVADAIGMPDEQDYEVLMKIINKFERNHPGLIQATLKAGRRDFETGIYRKNVTWKGKALVNSGSNTTYVFELPADLVHAIEKVFPSMFRSKKHFRWFKKRFSRLTITGEGK